ncbi:hypothetical protein CPB84DRAFT_1843085 [Gymnopilus junonius]|uniref:EXPERA domain-containing protein n=1 Tax=Gymnopilus junonius TaxID=109634 RepID=A0A9P5NZJ7_GYMJU|nr:hypothetical protein CPB84DRAFT_1843085 [Gymnopilus junonius]
MLVANEKQLALYNHYARLPLTARPLDFLYFLFFAIHLPATVMVDLQYFYSPQFVPRFMRALLDMHIEMSRDPLVGGVDGAFGDSSHLTWFKTFLALEAIFQVPVFLLGLRALYRGSRSIYPLLMIYGASSATTTLACITTVLQTPGATSTTIVQGIASVTAQQRLVLLSSYVPFFLVPFIMAVDITLRVSKLVQKAIKQEDEEKWK